MLPPLTIKTVFLSNLQLIHYKIHDNIESIFQSFDFAKMGSASILILLSRLYRSRLCSFNL